MFCPRQGPGGGGHKGQLSGLGASRSRSAGVAPFLLLRLPVPSLRWDSEAAAIGGCCYTEKKKRGSKNKQTKVRYKAPQALPQTSHRATFLTSAEGDPT